MKKNKDWKKPEVFAIGGTGNTNKDKFELEYYRIIIITKIYNVQYNEYNDSI